MPAADVPADEEPRHPDHPVKTRLPGVRVPANPQVAGREGRSRAGEHEAAKPAVVRGDQVAQLPAAVLGRALRMLVLEQAGKDPRLVAAGDRAHLEPVTAAARSGTPQAAGTGSGRTRGRRVTPMPGPGGGRRMRPAASRSRSAAMQLDSRGLPSASSKPKREQTSRANAVRPGKLSGGGMAARTAWPWSVSSARRIGVFAFMGPE